MGNWTPGPWEADGYGDVQANGEGSRYFCCGNEVSFNIHPSRWPAGSIEGRVHSPDCWYVAAQQALTAYDKEFTL